MKTIIYIFNILVIIKLTFEPPNLTEKVELTCRWYGTLTKRRNGKAQINLEDWGLTKGMDVCRRD